MYNVLFRYFKENTLFVSTLILIIFVTVFFVIFHESKYGVFWNNYDGVLYYSIYQKISQGQVPFKDFNIEYPPLATYLLTFPMSLFKNLSLDRFLEMYIATVGVYLLVFVIMARYFLTKITGDRRNIDRTHAMACVLLVILSFFTFGRYDIFVAFYASIALFAYAYYVHSSSQKYLYISIFLLAVAISLKVYPIVLIPLAMLLELFRKKYVNLLKSGLLLISLLAFFNLSFIISGYEGFKFFAEYQGDRDLQLESTAASFLLVGEQLGINTTTLAFQNGSFELINPLAVQIADVSNLFVVALLLVILLYVGSILYRERQRLTKENILSVFAISSVVLVLVFILFYNVFSPQYLVWILCLIPLLTLVQNNKNKLFYSILVLFFVATFLTAILVPFKYSQLVDKQILPVFILLFRNVALCINIILLIVLLRKDMVRSV